MATQLSIYTAALSELSSKRLTVLTESREARRVLDSFWPDTVAYCLAQGQWRFAVRTVQIDSDPSGVPQFGWNYRFVIPGDWVRTVEVSTVPEMDPPLVDYDMQTGFWYGDVTPLYISFVSNDPTYGMNVGAWPPNFADYVGTRLARRACMQVTGDRKLRDDLVTDEEKARRVAKGTDAMNEPNRPAPLGTWTRARRGNVGGGLFGPGSVATGPAGDD